MELETFVGLMVAGTIVYGAYYYISNRPKGGSVQKKKTVRKKK